jgi:hypothetical protein
MYDAIISVHSSGVRRPETR